MPDELKRGYGYWTILALSIGAIMGTTLYFGTPIVAQYSGNLLIAAWIILSIIALYIAACFGELCATFPKAGGAYEFSKQAYGRFFSFIIAWAAWLFGSISTVVVIIAAVNSLNIGLSFLQSFLLSVGLIIALNMVAYLGVQASSYLLLLLGAIMIGIPVLIIAKGVTIINPAYFQPFFTHHFSSIFITLFFMAEAYFGWEAATYLAEETRNPTKVIPKALMHASLIIGILGLLLITVTLGIIPWQELQLYASPLSHIANILYGETGKIIVQAGIFLALIGTAAATVFSTPRLLLALARDKLFLARFQNLSSRFKTPANAIIFQTVTLILLLILGFANYIALLELLIPMAAVLYISMLLAVFVLRKKMPDKAREFKVPFINTGPFIAIIFFIIIIAAWLMTSAGAGLSLQTSLSLIALSIPLFLLVEFYYDPKAITGFSDVFAYATFIMQKITGSGGSTRKKIIHFLDDIKGRTILEYGCGVGTLTLKLIEEVGSRGRVYAVHFSKNYTKITQKRIEAKEWQSDEWNYGKVQVIHDPQQLYRIHPSVGYADAVVSVGLIGYVQDISKVLKELYAIMPAGGKLIFVENTDYFHMLPNVEWLSDGESIERLFRKAGFAVKVKKEKGLLWNKIYVFGIKYTGETPYV
ncbi:amino acid permease [Candidatus Woesearchaeota archaeon]|nr:amino acid permease [Candidatus Woesearchaeota archaeon]